MEARIKIIGTRELRNNLADILKCVEDGEEVIIAKRDEPIAKIVPIKRKRRERLAGRGNIRQAIRAHGTPLSDLVRDMREDRL